MEKDIKNKLTVIKGGKSDTVTYYPKDLVFLNAYVTDTRLMGVLGLSIAWEIINEKGNIPFHQFFYYDAEEYGLDTYESLQGDSPEILDLIEENLIGGLGGVKIPVTQAEALNLLNDFVEGSRKLDAPLASPTEHYLELIKDLAPLSPEEKVALIKKTYTPIRSDFHLINYYLMRTLAKDPEGAKYLLKDGKDPLENQFKKPGTLCKNTIEEHIDSKGQISYLCEALVDRDGDYEMVLLEIFVADGLVVDAKVNSSFKITPPEAVMLLNKSEFVSVYEILAEPVDFDNVFLPLMAGALKTQHANGRLYMEFNKNNEHVNQRVFRLNEDVHGLFYVSDYGQLLLSAFSVEKINSLEKFLQKGPLSLMLMPTAKYEFKEPIVYEFIQSDFEDFEDFILSLQ